jgi:hypothetical protein
MKIHVAVEIKYTKLILYYITNVIQSNQFTSSIPI